MKFVTYRNDFLKKVLTFLNVKETFNYIYFGFFLIVLLSINTLHILTVNQGSSFAKWFFLAYSAGQILIETVICVLLSVILKRFASKIIYFFYIGCVFIFVLAQSVESILVKLMDLSFKEGLYSAFGADLANFIELLRLTEIGMSMWVIMLVVGIAFPFIGVGFYKITDKISCKKPLYLTRHAFFSVLIGIPLMLCSMDYTFSQKLLYTEYGSYKKALPWKYTFFKMDTNKIFLKTPLKEKPDPSLLLGEIEQQEFHKVKKPNIYLFVVESLRDDYVNEETAPNLIAFKQNYISAKHSFANANSTHNSWYSIFHSTYPFHWSYAKTPSLQTGSIPLNILKKMGYKIHIYSSAQLKFYGFDHVILGKNHALADTIKVFPHYGDKSASDTDREALEAFRKDSYLHEKEGNLYLIFLDSTHFNYSWPKDFPEKFQPADKVTWEHRLSNDINKLAILKNRYKNSIAFVDHLFSKTMLHLKRLGVYNESIVVFCGDHGEEFKEQGRLFHASHLNPMQTQIPIFYKFGKSKVDLFVSSHIEIFPSIIHYIDQDVRFLKYFDGHSIFDSKKPNFAVTARYNACFHPCEFLLHNGSHYLMLKFDKKDHIYSSNALKILGYYEHLEEKKISTEEAIHSFKEAFHHLFEVDASRL
jgi:hypothetical protein